MVMKLARNWHNILEEELKKPYINVLKAFLQSEVESGATIFPPERLVFNAFHQTPFDQVKVVIMGQDPYHGPRQAHGLSFSVEDGITPPPSLKNIYKEIQSDLGIPPPQHGNLTKWARQGVLMLNATLTVRAREPKSHYGQGWEQFTDSVIEKLTEREDPLVFILWGKSASEKCERILNVKKHTHLVLKSAHPSPYSANFFFGCKHFSRCNQALQKWGKEPIDWSL